jgi:hypothetical protein
MRPEPEIIVFGENSWLIRPLTLRQVQELEPISAALARGEAGQIESVVKMLAAALRRDHARYIDALPDLHAGIDEIRCALAAIMRLSGLVKEETGQGEVQAAPAAKTTGEAYTDA